MQGWYQTSHEMIAARAVGAETPAMLEKLNLTPLTRRQVQEALVRLADKNLIYFTFCRERRKSFFGNPSILSMDEWMRKVGGYLTTPPKKRRGDSCRDLKLVLTPTSVVFKKKRDGKTVMSYGKPIRENGDWGD
jgi:hypothetical protein